ncbi:ATP-binding cassette domain-containing protein, partial [bacterium AH-315-G05]|nr:ATP-binding cassette domain-containing protein [bacterium AH-315-G05]
MSKTTILKNISFNVAKGEIVGLIGPSGAGKTTIVRTITGIV